MIDESLALKYTARNPFGCNIRTNCKKIFAKKYKKKRCICSKSIDGEVIFSDAIQARRLDSLYTLLFNT